MNDKKTSGLYPPLPTIAITIFIYVMSQVVAGILVALVPLLNDWSLAQTTAWLESNVWATFGFIALLEAVTLYLIYWFLKRRNAGFGTLGINTPRFKYAGYALSGFAAYFVLYIISIIIIKAAVPGLDLEQKQEIGFDTTTSGLELIPVFFSLVILPPVTEEIVVRGFLYGGLRTRLNVLRSATAASMMFAAAHLGGASEGLLWTAVIDTFILSIVLCYLREKTGSLWPPIGVHMLKNGLAFVVLFNILDYIR